MYAPDDDAITDVTAVNKQNGVSCVLLSFQLLNSNFIKQLLSTYELFVNCTTGNMCSYIYDQIYAIRTCERFRE